jgi:hypothetical protein
MLAGQRLQAKTGYFGNIENNCEKSLAFALDMR